MNLLYLTHMCTVSKCLCNLKWLQKNVFFNWTVCVDTTPHHCGQALQATDSSCESYERLAHPVLAFTYDVKSKVCLELDFDGCWPNNVFLDLAACRKGDISPSKSSLSATNCVQPTHFSPFKVWILRWAFNNQYLLRTMACQWCLKERHVKIPSVEAFDLKWPIKSCKIEIWGVFFRWNATTEAVNLL